jgi:hypothetical protein
MLRSRNKDTDAISVVLKLRGLFKDLILLSCFIIQFSVYQKLHFKKLTKNK